MNAYKVGLDIGSTTAKMVVRPHPLQKTFPSAIVSLFEDNGFIWGGKWEHFDLMHFEYRPELIIKAKKLRAQANGEKPEDAS